MEREKINEWIDRFNEGRLKGKDLEAFLRLLEEDPGLRKEVAADREINRMLEERELLEFRKTMLETRKGMGSHSRRWMLLAAALLVLALFGGYVFYRLVLMPDKHLLPAGTITEKADSLKGIQEEDHPAQEADSAKENTLAHGVRGRILLAERYKPDPSMESLVGEVTRAGGIRLQNPPYSETIRSGSDVRFAWTSELPVSLEIQLFDNKGMRVFSSEKISGEEYMLKTGSFEPGLYYWKLLLKGKLATAGKVKIIP